MHYLVVDETRCCLYDFFRFSMCTHGLCSNVFAKRFLSVNCARALHEPSGKSVAARGVSWSLCCAGVGGAHRHGFSIFMVERFRNIADELTL